MPLYLQGSDISTDGLASFRGNLTLLTDLRKRKGRGKNKRRERYATIFEFSDYEIDEGGGRPIARIRVSETNPRAATYKFESGSMNDIDSTVIAIPLSTEASSDGKVALYLDRSSFEGLITEQEDAFKGNRLRAYPGKISDDYHNFLERCYLLSQQRTI